MNLSSTTQANQTVTADQFHLLNQLASVNTPQEIAALIVQLAQTNTNCKSAHLLWNVKNIDEYLCEPSKVLTKEEQTLLSWAVVNLQHKISSDGLKMAIPLFDHSPAVLIIELNVVKNNDVTTYLSDMFPTLQLAGSHLQRALKTLDLQSAIIDLERSERLQRALFTISDLAGSGKEMSEVLRGIHSIVDTLMYARNFFIVLHNNESKSFRFVYYADIYDLPPDPNMEVTMDSRVSTLTWHVLNERKTLMGNPDQIQAQVSSPLRMLGTEAKFILAAPLMRDGFVLGAVVVQSYQSDISFQNEDRTLLEFVGSNILVALERKQGIDDLEQHVRLRTIELANVNQGLQLEIAERQRAERLHVALFHIAQLATADISQSELYLKVHAEVSALINAENFFIGLLAENDQELHFPFGIDRGGDDFIARKIGRGLSEYVINHGKVNFRKEDLPDLIASGELDLETIGIIPTSWIGVPLLVGDKTIGLVVVQSYDDSTIYTKADEELLDFAASQIANTLHRRLAAENLQKAYEELEQRVQDRTQELLLEINERERIQDQLKHEVMHDSLTHLPNRSYLLDKLTRSIAQLKRDAKHNCALMYLDVDRFKVINDSLGHLAGDQVLKEVARRLLFCVREPDIVARLSGDEFAILLIDTHDTSSAVKVAQRIISTLREPLMVAGKELNPSVSVGVAIIDNHYHLADEALRDADLALYRAKKLGRNRFEMFDETLQKNAVNILAIESELRIAMQKNQFEPYFQPIVEFNSKKIVGFEALIRWNHPTRGTIGPFDFLRIAEENGSLEAIDWHMYELSCRLMAQLTDDDTYLTINCSPLHFRHSDFDTKLLTLLKKTGLSAHRLITEITEGSLLEDSNHIRATLERLRSAGIGAALDDFGTGYSSLSYLHKFPWRILKIDRSFVMELGKNNSKSNSSITVISAILAMAKALDLKVIAEGIETPEQQQALIEMGCEFGQGYLLARPAPIQHWTNLTITK